METKVFLGNAPWTKPGYYGVRAGSRWPHFQKIDSVYMPFPFFLAYTSALLKREGVDVLFVDGVAEKIDKKEFLNRIYSYNPSILVLEVSTISIKTDLEYANEIKNKLGASCKIIFSGMHTEMHKPDFLKNFTDVDMVMVGEYEFTLLDIVKHRNNNHSFNDIPGLLFRDETNVIVQTKQRPVIDDLDALPWPDRDSVPIYNYRDTPWDIPTPSVQMWASRGCPFQCVFCAWPQIMYGGHLYRVRKPVDVADEMEMLIKKYDFKSIYFDDDTFNIGKKRIINLCNEIKKRNLHNIPWAVMARADTMDEEMLVTMKDAGLVALKYGVESADQSIVDRSGKGLDLEKVKKIIELTKKLGIKIHLTYTFGLPGETKETIDKTIALALEHDPDSLQFSIITPWPGSKLFNELDKKGHLISKNWSEYDGFNTAVIQTDTLSKEDLEKALRRAYATWEKHQALKNMKQKPFHLLYEVISKPTHAINKIKNILFPS